MPYVNLQITKGATRKQKARIVKEFTQTLVAAIEQYGKRKVGRRKAREGQPGALPQP